MAMHTTDRLMATPRGSREDALAFFSRLQGVKRFDQVTLYIETVYDLAPRVGIDPSIIIAHAANETNYFRDENWELRLNPAGMGVTEKGVKGETFVDGRAAARAHVAHMLLYATGTISFPLTQADDPRYDDYLNYYGGNKKMADTIEDLAGTWATDDNTHNAIVNKGNEIFQNLDVHVEVGSDDRVELPKSKPVFNAGVKWDGKTIMRYSGKVYRPLRRTVTVGVDKLNTRVYPTTKSEIVQTLDEGTELQVLGWVTSQKVGAWDKWWITDTYEHVWAGGTIEKPA